MKPLSLCLLLLLVCRAPTALALDAGAVPDEASGAAICVESKASWECQGERLQCSVEWVQTGIPQNRALRARWDIWQSESNSRTTIQVGLKVDRVPDFGAGEHLFVAAQVGGTEVFLQHAMVAYDQSGKHLRTWHRKLSSGGLVSSAAADDLFGNASIVEASCEDERWLSGYVLSTSLTFKDVDVSDVKLWGGFYAFSSGGDEPVRVGYPDESPWTAAESFLDCDATDCIVKQCESDDLTCSHLPLLPSAQALAGGGLQNLDTMAACGLEPLCAGCARCDCPAGADCRCDAPACACVGPGCSPTCDASACGGGCAGGSESAGDCPCDVDGGRCAQAGSGDDAGAPNGGNAGRAGGGSGGEGGSGGCSDSCCDCGIVGAPQASSASGRSGWLLLGLFGLGYLVRRRVTRR